MTAPAAPRIRSRKPTGRVPWPVLLVEGGEKSGKSYSAALLSSSERVGRTFWIDLGEGSADEYGAIPGVRYEVIEHDGSYPQVLDQVRAVKAEAARAAAAGEPPTVLVIDTITDLWEGLKDWAANRARARRKKGPDEEVTVSMDLWNDSGARYRKVMTELLTFPGVVILLARGKEIALVEGGKPVEGKKDYRVEGHKTLAYDATAWVRMSRTGPPQIIGARSVHAGIRPGRDEPYLVTDRAADGALLEWLIFDGLRCDPQTAHVRDIKATTGGELSPEESGSNQPVPAPPAADSTPPDAAVVNQLLAHVQKADSLAALKAVWEDLQSREQSGAVTGAGAAVVRRAINARKAEFGPVGERTLTRLHTVLTNAGVTASDQRLLAVARLAERPDIESSKELTEQQALAVIRAVETAGPDVDLVTGETVPPGVGVPLNADGMPIDSDGNEIDDPRAFTDLDNGE